MINVEFHLVGTSFFKVLTGGTSQSTFSKFAAAFDLTALLSLTDHLNNCYVWTYKQDSDISSLDLIS